MASEFIPINLAIQTYQSRSGLASNERLVNLYAELTPPESKSKVALFRTPGATIWKAINNYNPIYGMKVMGDFLYVVCGLDVYQINSSKTATLLGTMDSSPARVMITENGLQLTFLTESGIAYYYDVGSTTFAQITDGDFELSNAVTTIDGYTVSVEQESQTFQISSNLDTTTWAALDFAQAQAESDNLVTVLNYNRQLILMGSRSTEIWYDTGNNTFPFQPVDGVLLKSGTTAKYSAVADLTGVYWLGQDKIIYQATNYAHNRISTYGIEKLIESFDVIDDAFSFVYVQEGHRFLVITFPTENRTIVYDITTGLWHERSSVNPNMVQQTNNAWLANCYENFAELQLVGDANTGTIYQLDLDNYQENGTPILWEIISATQFDNYKRDSVGRFVLWMDTGTGIVNGQGSDPQIMLQTSKDGGKTWSTEQWQPLGAMGEYCTEIWWDQVEYGRNFLAKLRGSDPVNIAITGAFIEITQGRP